MKWVDALFRPRAVAVIGSVGAGKIGRVLIEQLVAGGFERVVAVNPKGEGASGLSSPTGVRDVSGVRSLQEVSIGDRPDLVVVASPAATVADVLEDAGKAGAKVAVIITAGFRESGDARSEAKLLEVADRFGLRLVGPNCAGIVNTKWNLFPTLETRPPRGDVAFVSQSGALGGAVLSWAEAQDVGFSKFVSYGNGADLTDVDFLDALRTDEETKVVAAYLETVSDGRRFMEAARRLAAEKPLVVIKSGRSDVGGRATLSHTGSLAGADAVYDAALRQCGGIRVDGIEEMFDLCRGFVHLPPVRGKRVVIVTNSGGPGVLAADRAEALGLDLSAPSPELNDRLAARLPSFCSLGNPIDLTVQGDADDYRDALVAALEEYDAALAIDVNTPYLDPAPIARGIVDAARATGKSIAANFMAGKTVAAALPILDAGGVPNFVTGERAVRALAALASRATGVARAQRALSRKPLCGSRIVESPAPSSRRLPWKGQGLEPEVLDWLESEDLPVPRRRFVASADEAARAAIEFADPVAMKLVAEGALHKSESGGVILDVMGESESKAAFSRLERVGEGKGFRGVLVVPMVQGAVEVLVGLSRDPQFGPVVAVGLGGIYAEALNDVALRVAPVDRDEALEMIEELRGAAILRGARGRRPHDLVALATLLARVSRLAFRYHDLAELDLNPVFLREDGLTIGDGRAIRSPNDGLDPREEGQGG